MNENLKNLLIRLSKDHTLLNSVEEVAKQGAVLPVLSSLGWDCFNMQEVTPEFSVGNGRIDYCLRTNKKNAVFIEVKRASVELDRHEKQLLEYSFTHGVEIAILTNGLTWWFYLPLVAGDWQQRKFISIDIRQQKLETATDHFQEFLSKTSITEGTAVKSAKAVRKSREKNKLIKQTLPEAWEQLLGEPDEFLLEILADKVESICGYNPDPETLTKFIYEFKSTNTSLPQTLTASANTFPQQSVEPAGRMPARPSTRQRGISIVIGKETINATTVGDLYLQALKYICDNNYITNAEEQIPYATSARRFLISRKPVHQRGNEFRVPIEYNGFYMETHKSYESALKQLEDFLKVCGLKMKNTSYI